MSESATAEKRDGLVKVKILEKKMRASVHVVSSLDEGAPPTAEMTFAALKKEKVTFGIDTHLVHSIINENRFDRDVDIAF